MARSAVTEPAKNLFFGELLADAPLDSFRQRILELLEEDGVKLEESGNARDEFLLRKGPSAVVGVLFSKMGSIERQKIVLRFTGRDATA